MVVATVRGAVGGVMAGNYYHRFEHLAPYITLATDGTGEGEKHPGRGWSAPAVRVGGAAGAPWRSEHQGTDRGATRGSKDRADDNEG